MTTPFYFPPGEISHSTFATQDLLSVFSSYLEHAILSSGRAIPSPLIETEQWLHQPLSSKHEERGDELMLILFDALNEFAPPGHYFGSSEGNGSSFGFWAIIDYPLGEKE
jgi:hypothetical protein